MGWYPDFIIGGAPKCGTTSLHFILDQHPGIGLLEFLGRDLSAVWKGFDG